MIKGLIPPLLFIMLLFAAVPVVADPKPDELWHEYKSEQNPKKQTALLLQLSEYYFNNHNASASDSVLGIAIETAEMTGDDTLLMQTYRQYFRLKEDKFLYRDRAYEYANNMMAIARNHNNNTWFYYAYSAITKTIIAPNNADSALDKVNRAFYYVGLTNNDTLKAECFLLWGKCLEQTNHKIDAFRNYLNALYLAQKHENHKLIFESYGRLSTFYLLVGNYERAKEYKIKQFPLLPLIGKGSDSVKIMTLLSDLAERYYYNNERANAEKITNRMIDYAMRHNDSDIRQRAFDNHRIYLIQNGYFKDLVNFYTQQYPLELKKLAIKDAISYERIMAYSYELKHNTDSASYFLKHAEELILEKRANENIYISNFMKRYGQYLLRTGNTALAKTKMEESYNYALKADYLPYLIETSNYLDSLNYAEGNLKEAYHYSKLNKEYAQRQDAVTKQDAMLQMEIDNETKQRELIAEQEQEHTEHRHNVQYMGIIIGIVLSFIVLIMLGSFKVPRIFIKSLGFFSFIFFFEFIILIADHKIMAITHHEPWKMLGIKILIISILLPFHHWIEHKLISYLMEHQLIDTSKLSPRRLFYKTPEPDSDKKETGH